jgi:hypothetical protein
MIDVTARAVFYHLYSFCVHSLLVPRRSVRMSSLDELPGNTVPSTGCSTSLLAETLKSEPAAGTVFP